MRLRRLYIGFMFFILVIILLFTIKDEYNHEEEKQENTEVKESTLSGGDIVKEYNSNIDLIETGKYVINIVNIKGNNIEYSNADELKSIIYLFQSYERREYTKNDITYVNFNLESYSNLLNVLSNANMQESDKAKLRLYYEEDVEVGKNKDVNAPRNLKEGELYGSTVISNFNGHENDIVSGKVYFKIITEGKTKTIQSRVALEKEVEENYIYTKDFELTKQGTLKGYTFTRVMN